MRNPTDKACSGIGKPKCGSYYFCTNYGAKKKKRS